MLPKVVRLLHSWQPIRLLRPIGMLTLCGMVTVTLAWGILNITYQPKPFAVQLYPWTSPIWNIGPLNAVKMSIEDTSNYQLEGSTAAAQWAALVPENGVVHVEPTQTPYMLSMFHQLKCLDILRRVYAEEHKGSLDAAGRHCLNYLRQTLLCRADLRLESVQDPDGPHSVDMWGDLTCSDWRQVYARVEKENKF